MGLGGLNPYSLGSSGLGSAYDQLAQQYNLLNGATSSASNTSSTQSKSHQSQSKSSQSRNTTASANSAASLMNAMASMGGGASTVTTPSTSASGSGRGRQSSSRNQSQTTPTAADMAQLSSLLMPGADPHLLESLSRMSNMDLAQATRLMSSWECRLFQERRALLVEVTHLQAREAAKPQMKPTFRPRNSKSG